MAELCVGRGSLTESELLLHKALDFFRVNDAKSFHNRVHKLFGRARGILKELDLLQHAENAPKAVYKRRIIKHTYTNNTEE